MTILHYKTTCVTVYHTQVSLCVVIRSHGFFSRSATPPSSNLLSVSSQLFSCLHTHTTSCPNPKTLLLLTKNLTLLHSENGSEIEDNVEEKEREFVFFQQSIIKTSSSIEIKLSFSFV